uniref:Uncharacterized protein n=1 Tax=Parascaris univalens TaxID=6257 RepID=A0A914ZJT7_PARUN
MVVPCQEGGGGILVAWQEARDGFGRAAIAGLGLGSRRWAGLVAWARHGPVKPVATGGGGGRRGGAGPSGWRRGEPCGGRGLGCDVAGLAASPEQGRWMAGGGLEAAATARLPRALGAKQDARWTGDADWGGVAGVGGTPAYGGSILVIHVAGGRIGCGRHAVAGWSPLKAQSGGRP